MVIPGTKKLFTSNQAKIPNGGELFCFCIQDISQSNYLEDFLDKLNSHLPEYVFNQNNLAVHQERFLNGSTRKSPLEVARGFLQKTHAGRAFDSGEFGEFLLYLFAKKVKGAHKLATKISARGSTTTTLPGRDGTFAWRDENGEVYMLLGEAKTKPASNDGLRLAQSDLNKFWSSGRINHEISLASTHIQAEMTAENAAIYEAYFIDDNDAHTNLRYKNIIFVGYSFGALKDFRSGALSETDFLNDVCADLQRSFSNQSALIDASPHPSIYCFIPFESIDDARTEFARSNNLII